MPTKPKTAATKTAIAPKQDRNSESIQSILALLRGLEDVLVGSSPNPEEIRSLFAALKSPEDGQDV